MQEKINRKWCLVRRPVGLIKESDFKLRLLINFLKICYYRELITFARFQLN
jgi:hypothetical protein